MLAHRRAARRGLQQLDNLQNWQRLAVPAAGSLLARAAIIRSSEGEPCVCRKGHHSTR